MADEAQLARLKRGAAPWNAWVAAHPEALIDLSGADLAGWDLCDVNLAGSVLSYADLRGARLCRADLHDSDLTACTFDKATLIEADLSRSFGPAASFARVDARQAIFGESRFGGANFDDADLSRADLESCLLPGVSFRRARLKLSRFRASDLIGANLDGCVGHKADFSETRLMGATIRQARLRAAIFGRANLTDCDLTDSDLSGASLEQATLVDTLLEGTELSGAAVHGIAAWDLRGTPKAQLNLVVTPRGRADAGVMTVDDLEVAQFLYLLISHRKLQTVLNTVSNRGVLLLGRFRDGGLETLNAVADVLRKHAYLPIIFDFDRPAQRSYTETVKILVGLSCFVIVDLSGPSVPQELAATVPHFKIPFVPIIERGRAYASMLVDFLENDWVLSPPVEYGDRDELVALLPEQVIAPAEARQQARQQRLKALYE